MRPSSLGPFNRRHGVGFTVKWALTPKLRSFKANKYLNPVSKNKYLDVLIYRPEIRNGRNSAQNQKFQILRTARGDLWERKWDPPPS